MKKIAVFWIICLFLSLFAGCSFSSSEENISGGGSKKSFHKVCGSSSLKMDSSRNAFPSYQAENLFYYFYVKNSDGNTEKESFGAENSFSFSLENGEWIIFCDVYYGSALDDENFKADGNIIFSGSNSISLDDTSGDETDFKITTKIYSSENAKGNANLKIFSSVSAVKSAKAEWTDSEGNSFSQVLGFSDSSKAESGEFYDVFNFGGNSMPAGAYKVRFSFYDGAVSGGNVSGTKVCVTVKTINIACSLTTDVWSDDGSFVSGGSGKFVFSENCIKISKAKALYVSGRATENGSGILPAEPMNSLDSAFDLLFNFSMDNVPVCILEGTTATFTRNVELSESVKNLTVTTYKADGTICSEKSVVVPEDERGAIKRADNLIQILDGGIEGAAINFVNVNIYGNDSADATSVNSFVDVASADVSATNCKVRDDFFLRSSDGKAGSISLCNADFSFSGNGASSSTQAVFIDGGISKVQIEECRFKGFEMALRLNSSAVEANVVNSSFFCNITAVGGYIFKSLMLSGVTLKESSKFGIDSNLTFTLAGTCTFDDTFYLSENDAYVNFDESYKDDDSGSSPNSVFVSIPSSNLVRGKKVLSGENIETNRTNFTVLEDGWQINNGGFLYESNAESSENRFYYVDPQTSCAAPEPGDYDKPYKTLQAAVDAVVLANKTENDKEYTIYVLNNIVGSDSEPGIKNNSLVSVDSGSDKLNLAVEPFGSYAGINAARNSSSSVKYRIFYIGGNVELVLSRLNLYGGYAEGNGGAIYLNGTAGAELTLENCTVGKSNPQIEDLQDGVQNQTYSPDETNCSNCADEGGGIYAEGRSGLTLNSTKVLNCFAKSSSGGGGGISVDSSYLSIDDGSEIYANGSAGANGAAVCAKESEIYFNDGIVRHHYEKETVMAAVPGIYLFDSTLDIYDGEIRDNYYPKANFGSGIFIGGSNSSVSMYGGSVSNNSSVAKNVQSCDIGYSVSVSAPVVSLSGGAYVETIYSPKTYIKILDELSAFSSSKTCKIYTTIAEGTEVLQAETKDIPLADYIDFFKLYGTDLKESVDFSLGVDSTGDKLVAKIVKGGGAPSSGTPISSVSSKADIKDGGKYSVSTESDLEKFASLSQDGCGFYNATIIIEKDIDLKCDSSDPFTPIGTGTGFAGIFDGNGHKISNLYVSATNQAGLFAFVNGGTVKNLTIEGTVIENGSTTAGSIGVGGIAGYTSGTVTIENCVSNVKITSGCENTGGIVGYVNSPSVIRNCINLGNIDSSKANSGGILGSGVSSAVVYNCANFGTVSGTTYVGGIVGKTENDVSLCYNVGAITASAGDSTAAAIANVSGTESTFYQYCYFKTGTASAAFNGSSGSNIIEFSDPKQQNLSLELSNRINDSKYKEFCHPWDKTYNFDGVEYPVCVEIK